MELIQVEEVLLVVGVPEAFVGDIQVGQTAHVDLFAQDRFRRKRPSLRGTVHRVAEAADDSTGLFEVEILVPNQEGVLKPGRIGLAHIVVQRCDGFRVPITCAVFRDGKTWLFSVGDDDKAHSFKVERWIEQGPDMILSELPPEHQRIVVRGQHRLVDGRSVREVPEPATGAPTS
jgi:multidrug efflux pump subunit AcrA (membrane-fusion protein)